MIPKQDIEVSSEEIILITVHFCSEMTGTYFLLLYHVHFFLPFWRPIREEKLCPLVSFCFLNSAQTSFESGNCRQYPLWRARLTLFSDFDGNKMCHGPEQEMDQVQSKQDE